jgi:hypothetical protein
VHYYESQLDLKSLSFLVQSLNKFSNRSLRLVSGRPMPMLVGMGIVGTATRTMVVTTADTDRTADHMVMDMVMDTEDTGEEK